MDDVMRARSEGVSGPAARTPRVDDPEWDARLERLQRARRAELARFDENYAWGHMDPRGGR